MKTNLAVECRNLTKHFGTDTTRVQVLRGINLTVPRGELTLLAGPSGCGKTTLISIVAALLEPSGGEVHVLGQNLGELSSSGLQQFRAEKVGFVFQQYNLLPALTAQENAALPLLIARQPRAAALARSRDMLAAVGLADKTQSKPRELSGGQQQRVAIARALVHDPELLVCDEPTAALDGKSGQTVMQLLREVSIDPRRAVLVVTHDSRVFEFGDRIIHMSDGVIEQDLRLAS